MQWVVAFTRFRFRDNKQTYTNRVTLKKANTNCSMAAKLVGWHSLPHKRMCSHACTRVYVCMYANYCCNYFRYTTSTTTLSNVVLCMHDFTFSLYLYLYAVRVLCEHCSMNNCAVSMYMWANVSMCRAFWQHCLKKINIHTKATCHEYQRKTGKSTKKKSIIPI